MHDDYRAYQFHLIYRKVHNFCAVDLGAFYLDVIKDRQYTCRADGAAAASAQTAMYHVLELLVRWLAPILTFTADEIWRFMPPRPESPRAKTASCWSSGTRCRLRRSKARTPTHLRRLGPPAHLRDAVNRQLERLRMAGAIGSSLDAEVDLYVDARRRRAARHAGRRTALRADLLVRPCAHRPRQRRMTPPRTAGLWVAARASAHPKCMRCWHHREDVGGDAEHPELCGRCVENVAGSASGGFA